ncbi:helix-turn-helix domain-containing protein [Sphingobium sp.]|uniref:MarR family winged helix-turn-helix transcriptional regulator n=1 Tax=Sphingobium sp. TaxID=1912891 RepID=UPI0028BEFA54|nr:helix-turn-helix domain-containing protein [Sphingobium sp.]
MKEGQAADESIFVGLMNAVNWFDEAFQNSLEAAGYARTTRVESFVIVNIAAGRQRPADIARNLGVSRQAISQILKAFAERGWIVTRPDPNHGKAQIVMFSAAFSERAELCGHIITGIVRELEQRIGGAAVEALKLSMTADWGTPPRITIPAIGEAPTSIDSAAPLPALASKRGPGAVQS